MFIGISSQKNSLQKIFQPLDISTNSGKFITQLETALPNQTSHKTNLIKCAPLLPSGKIRYPTNKEINSCFPHLEKEIKSVQPKIIIPLGKQVTTYFSKHFQIPLKKYHPTKLENFTILPIDHPSYLMIYKRKNLEDYRNKIIKLIQSVKCP